MTDIEKVREYCIKEAIRRDEPITGGEYLNVVDFIDSLAEQAEPDGCVWKRDIERFYESDVYETSCDNAIVLNDGTPEENGCKFCHFCGRKIKMEE